MKTKLQFTSFYFCFYNLGDLRVCTYCGKIVLSYLQSPDMAAHLSADLRALQEDLQTKFGDPLLTEAARHGSSTSLTPDREDCIVRRKPSLGYQEEKFANSRSFILNIFNYKC